MILLSDRHIHLGQRQVTLSDRSVSPHDARSGAARPRRRLLPKLVRDSSLHVHLHLVHGEG